MCGGGVVVCGGGVVGCGGGVCEHCGIFMVSGRSNIPCTLPAVGLYASQHALQALVFFFHVVNATAFPFTDTVNQVSEESNVTEEMTGPDLCAIRVVDRIKDR